MCSGWQKLDSSNKSTELQFHTLGNFAAVQRRNSMLYDVLVATLNLLRDIDWKMIMELLLAGPKVWKELMG